MAKRRKKSEPKVAIDETLRRLAEQYDPQTLAAAVGPFLRQQRTWVPTCGREYSYTYEHIVGVEDCPIGDDQQSDIEADAQRLAEATVRRYCQRTERCKTLDIIESSPTGGGCNCGNVPIAGKTCVYVCRWTVKYKCVAALYV